MEKNIELSKMTIEKLNRYFEDHCDGPINSESQPSDRLQKLSSEAIPFNTLYAATLLQKKVRCITEHGNVYRGAIGKVTGDIEIDSGKIKGSYLEICWDDIDDSEYPIVFESCPRKGPLIFYSQKEFHELVEVIAEKSNDTNYSIN